MRQAGSRLLTVGVLSVAALTLNDASSAQNGVIDEDVATEAYIYLLGRALVIRQEHLDIEGQGLQYNVVHHNPLASVDFVNPNMSVTNSQLWIAVDDDTPVLLEIPKMISLLAQSALFSSVHGGCRCFRSDGKTLIVNLPIH